MCFDDFFQKGSRCIIIGIIIENLSLAVKAAIDIFKWTKINHIASPSGIECVPERCKDAASVELIPSSRRMSQGYRHNESEKVESVSV